MTHIDRSRQKWGMGRRGEGGASSNPRWGYATSLSLSGQIDNLYLLQYGDKNKNNNNKKKITTWNSIYQPW